MLIKKSKAIFIVSLILVILSLCGCMPMQGNNILLTPVQSSSENSIVVPNNDDKLKVIFLDVGQGGSQLILTPSGKTILLDGGANDKEKVMLHYLKQYNIKKIDVLIGSHPDADHIGTLPAIIDALEIGDVYMPKVSSNTKTYERLLKSIKRKGLKIKTAKSGVQIELDEQLKIEMLGPIGSYSEKNNMSAVVKISHGSETFLFPGDAEYESESDMLKAGVNLSSTVLAVGHHGSNTSSSVKFLEKVYPKYAVIQVGADNKYGHPTNKTLKKLEKQKMTILRTDKNGTITFISDGKSLKVITDK